MTPLLRSLLNDRPELSVGVGTADMLRLGEELGLLERAGIRLVHVDIMDGVYCPQLTVGPSFVRALPEKWIKDVHLLIDEPLGKIEHYVASGADIMTFHVEATRHPHRVLQSLADRTVVRGVAINPGTPIATLEPLLDDLELILILAVNPGWPHQQYVASTDRKIVAARELIADREIALAVDGGVTKANLGRVASLGLDVIVTGSAVFDGGDAFANARSMLSTIETTHPKIA